IVHIVANSVNIYDVQKSCVNDCKKCLELEIELFKKKDFIEKEAYDKLVKSYSNLEKHCISLELATQLNQDIFQRENSGENLNAPTFNQLFEINDLKAQSQAKDTVIKKLKERITFLSEKDNVEKVKKDIDEIETINIELEHSVAKLLSKNENLRKEREHLKSIFKDQFDSIRKTRVQSKEHSLKNKLRRLKGKNVVNTVVSKPNVTLAPGMFKLDIEPISARLKNNRDAHEVYIDKPIEYAKTLHGFIELARTHEKLVAVTPRNKEKRVRFVEPVTSSNNIPKQTDSHKTKDSNKPLLTSIGVKPTTSSSGSKTTIGQITPKKIVHLKETTPKSAETPKPEIKVYSRRPKQIKSVGSSKKAKIVESKIANNSEPTHLWGSNATDVSSSSSLVNDRSKDEAPDGIIKCIKNIQVCLNATVRNVRPDNGTEFVNQTLRDFYENVSISHQTSVARTPQQNGIVERRNQNLVEAARTMLIFSKAPMFLWSKAINIACYT
ncbi:retrovirus-related pol polyprotein from transposon TNT 1-94, partial [Tanacetum coccineum]